MKTRDRTTPTRASCAWQGFMGCDSIQLALAPVGANFISFDVKAEARESPCRVPWAPPPRLAENPQHVRQTGATLTGPTNALFPFSPGRSVPSSVHADNETRPRHCVHVGRLVSDMAAANKPYASVRRGASRTIRAALFFGSVKSRGTFRPIKYTPVGCLAQISLPTRTARCVSRVARILLQRKPSCVP